MLISYVHTLIEVRCGQKYFYHGYVAHSVADTQACHIRYM